MSLHNSGLHTCLDKIIYIFGVRKRIKYFYAQNDIFNYLKTHCTNTPIHFPWRSSFRMLFFFFLWTECTFLNFENIDFILFDHLNFIKMFSKLNQIRISETNLRPWFLNEWSANGVTIFITCIKKGNGCGFFFYFQLKRSLNFFWKIL